MFEIDIAYNELSEPLVKLLVQTNIPVNAFNEDDYKQKKKAYALKNPYAARETPFAIFKYKDKPIKQFYSENGQCTLDHMEKFLKQWLKENAKSGNITIEQIEGTQKGRKEYGYTDYFIEGASLYLRTFSHWYRTSTIQKIDWDNKIFETLNSTYKFEFNESTSSKHE